jgi:hypothetical protein
MFPLPFLLYVRIRKYKYLIHRKEYIVKRQQVLILLVEEMLCAF